MGAFLGGEEDRTPRRYCGRCGIDITSARAETVECRDCRQVESLAGLLSRHGIDLMALADDQYVTYTAGRWVVRTDESHALAA